MRSRGLSPSCRPPCLLPGLLAPLSSRAAGTPRRSLTAPVREMVAPAVSERQPLQSRAGPGRAEPGLEEPSPASPLSHPFAPRRYLRENKK